MDENGYTTVRSGSHTRTQKILALIQRATKHRFGNPQGREIVASAELQEFRIKSLNY